MKKKDNEEYMGYIDGADKISYFGIDPNEPEDIYFKPPTRPTETSEVSDLLIWNDKLSGDSTLFLIRALSAGDSVVDRDAYIDEFNSTTAVLTEVIIELESHNYIMIDGDNLIITNMTDFLFEDE